MPSQNSAMKVLLNEQSDVPALSCRKGQQSVYPSVVPRRNKLSQNQGIGQKEAGTSKETWDTAEVMEG